MRALIAPLAMLLGGVAAGAALWHVLMLEPIPGRVSGGVTAERLSRQDQQALERLLNGRRVEQ